MRIGVRIVLAFAFVCSGAIKITDRVNPKLHYHMVEEFKQFSRVHPFALLFGHVPNPRTYMRTIGVLEVLGALMLLFGNTKIKIVSSFLLMTIMAGAVFTHFMMGHKFGQMVPAAVLFILLLAHLLRIVTDKPADTQKKTQ